MKGERKYGDLLGNPIQVSLTTHIILIIIVSASPIVIEHPDAEYCISKPFHLVNITDDILKVCDMTNE